MKFVKRILGAAIGGTMLIGLSAPSAEAGYVVDLTQEGSNVVANGSGAIDLTGLTFVHTFSGGPGEIIPHEFILSGFTQAIGIGAGLGAIDLYSGVTEPANFGSGGLTKASSTTGDPVGIFGALGVPQGYASDSPLSDSATYLSQTFSSLGATPGTYKWTWGSGANQSFTLVIGTAVPEPSTWVMMVLGFAGLAWAGWRGGRVIRTVRSA
jgi:hypothetical protein